VRTTGLKRIFKTLPAASNGGSVSSWSTLERWSKRLGANRLVLALSAARLSDAVGNSIVMVVLPLYVAVLPAPLVPVNEPQRVGFLLAAYGIVATVVQPVAGIVSDHLRRRKLLVQLGLLVMAGATLAFDFADTFFHLLLLRAFQGVGVALTVPAAMALLTTGSVRETRGGSMGVYTMARMAGLAVGPLLGGALYEWSGFSAAFFAGAAGIGLGIITVQISVHEKRDHARVAPEQKGDLRRVIGAPLLTLGLVTMIMAAAFTMMATLETQFNERLHQGAFAFSVAFSALMVTRLVFQVPLGRLSDRIGRKPLVIGGLLLLSVSTGVLGFSRNTWELSGLRLIQGLAAAAISAPSSALAGDLTHGGREARQMSVVTAGFTLGIAVGPLIAGALAPFMFELPFIVGGGLCLLAAWAVQHYVPETVVRRKRP
jgi:MFS family permease